MRNIEIKTISGGKFAVINESSRNRNELPLREESIYLNLDQVELFKKGKTTYEKTVSFERRQKYCKETGDYVYTDNLPEESENFKSSFSFNWDLTIPEGTPEIVLYFSKYECSLTFLNQEEYERIYNALTEKLV